MNAEEIVDRLIGMGYLRFTQPERRNDLRAELIRSLGGGYVVANWGDAHEPGALDRRIYAADSEYLAEGGVGQTILDMRRILEAEGVVLRNAEDITESGDRYEVIVNGRAWLIYDADEPPGATDWGLALKRTLEITNNLLQSAHSPERAFGLYGGNEGQIIILTQDMFDLLLNSGIAWERWSAPYPSSAITSKGHMLQ